MRNHEERINQVSNVNPVNLLNKNKKVEFPQCIRKSSHESRGYCTCGRSRGLRSKLARLRAQKEARLLIGIRSDSGLIKDAIKVGLGRRKLRLIVNNNFINNPADSIRQRIKAA